MENCAQVGEVGKSRGLLTIIATHALHQRSHRDVHGLVGRLGLDEEGVDDVGDEFAEDEEVDELEDAEVDDENEAEEW